MIFVLPMRGKGSRTKELGDYKYSIKANGQYIYELCIDHLVKYGIKPSMIIMGLPTFVKQKEYLDFYKDLNIYKNKLKKENIILKYVFIEEVPDGPALTVYEMINNVSLPLKEKVCVINPDQIVLFDNIKLGSFSGYVPLYRSSNPKKSYFELDSGYNVIRGVEKEVISEYASCGVYCFKDISLLRSGIEISKNKKELYTKSKSYNNGELFISTVINELLRNGYKFKGTMCSKKVDLGTTNNIKKYARN